ncbi:hypothetical protein MHYP_G00243360 [Metynnis hypsauchen]
MRWKCKLCTYGPPLSENSDLLLDTEVKAKWPALFTDKQIEAEFARLTSSDLWDTFVSGLDQYLERFLQMYKAKSHCIQTLSSLLSLLDDDNSVQRKRAVILRGLPHFLREDPSKLLKTAETTESEEQMAKGVNIGILLIQEEEDVLDFSMVCCAQLEKRLSDCRSWRETL